ncbi:unnamed protein product, partial [Discosporangium mesarthrocarpum]
MAGDFRAWDVTWASVPGGIDYQNFGCTGVNLTAEYTGDAACFTSLMQTATSAPLSGVFSLSTREGETPLLTHNASAAEASAALSTLSIVANVTLLHALPGGRNGGTYRITFSGTDEDTDLLDVKTTHLNGTGAKASVRRVVPGTRWGGEFALSFGGLETASLRFDASSDEVRHAIINLGVAEDVIVERETRETGFQWKVTFPGDPMGPMDLMEVTIDIVLLSGSHANVYRLSDGIDPVGGTFTLSTGGSTTVPIAWNATALEIESALEFLPSVGDVRVSVPDQSSPSVSSAWLVEFTTLGSPSNLGDLPLLQSDGLYLDGSGVTVAVTEVSTGCCAVEVTANGGTDYSSDGVSFGYQERPIVKQLSPQSGPASGGTSVTVVGTGFYPPRRDESVKDGRDLVCVFGIWMEAQATLINSTAVECVTPSTMRSGAVAVSVRWDGSVTASLSIAAFVYFEDVSLQHMSPSRGSNLGGIYTTLHVGQGSFIGVAEVSCVIEVRLPSNLTTAGFLSKEYLSKAELHDIGKGESYSCFIPGIDDFFGGAEASTWANGAWGATGIVRLSGNGGQDRTGHLLFSYHPVVRAANLDPPLGEDSGGTLVTVTGSGFVGEDEDNDLLCRFGHAREVPARFVSTTAIECRTPLHRNVPSVQSVVVDAATPFSEINEVLLRVPRSSLDNTTTSPLSGSWTLKLEDEVSWDLAPNASAPDVSAALSAMPNVGNVSVTVNHEIEVMSALGRVRDITVWTVTFIARGGDVPEMIGDSSNLFGGSATGAPDVVVRTIQDGHEGDGVVPEVQVLWTNRSDLIPETQVVTIALGSDQAAEVQVVSLAADVVLSGEFLLTYPGVGSVLVAHDASSLAMRASIQSMGSSIGQVKVSRGRTGMHGNTWSVTFDNLEGDRPEMVAENSTLRMSSAAGTVVLQVQTEVNGTEAIGGTFELGFGADSTGPLVHDVTAWEVESALEAL